MNLGVIVFLILLSAFSTYNWSIVQQPVHFTRVRVPRPLSREAAQGQSLPSRAFHPESGPQNSALLHPRVLIVLANDSWPNCLISSWPHPSMRFVSTRGDPKNVITRSFVH